MVDTRGFQRFSVSVLRGLFDTHRTSHPRDDFRWFLMKGDKTKNPQLVRVSVQIQNTLATSTGFLAVRGGFEPPVRLNTVRRFSKPVISATHPPNQVITFR